MSDTNANPDDAGIDSDDEQGLAEGLDDDEMGLDDTATGEAGTVAGEHPLASLEAAAVLDTGDVPEDSVRDRAWREEPEATELVDDRPVEVVDPEPDDGFDPAFAQAAGGDSAPEPIDAPFGDAVEPGVDTAGEVPGEIAAIHVVDDPER